MAKMLKTARVNNEECIERYNELNRGEGYRQHGG